jgi:hypothetical protein
MFGNNIAHIISKTSMALIFCHRDVYKEAGGSMRVWLPEKTLSL